MKKSYLNLVQNEAVVGLNLKDSDLPEIITFLLPDCKELYIQGLSREEIKKRMLVLSKTKGERALTEEELLTLVNRGAKLLSQEFDKDREFVVSLHVARYNDEIQKQLNIDVSDMNKYRAKEVKNYAYLQALELLLQKEKVLGLHSKALQIKINNTNNIKTTVRKKSYKLDRLSLEEMIELNNFVERCKKNLEVLDIIPRPKEEKVEDVGYQEIKEEKVIPINVQVIPEKVEDSSLKPIEPPKMFSDIENKLVEALKRQAEDTFKKTKGK